MGSATTRRTNDEAGFSLVEVMIGALLLMVGVFATLALLDTGNRASASSSQRDIANALAQEMIERAGAGRNSDDVNDMTDIIVASPTPGPADRLRAALDPDGEAASTAVTPPTPTATGAVPLTVPQSWTLRRRNTTFTVSYRACTHSDVHENVQIAGPFDCDRPTAGGGGGGGGTGTSGNCALELLQPTQIDPTDPGSLTARVQLLGLTGANVCVGVLLGDMATALCSAVGSSALVNGVYSGLLGAGQPVTGLLDLLGSGASVGVCPASQVETALLGATAAIGATTRLAVDVTWTDFSGVPRSISQTALVRRPAA